MSILFSTVLFSQGKITINVEGLKSNEGQLIILLFKKGDVYGINKVPFRKIKHTSILNNKASFSITEVEKGEYAFIIFHDEDNNGECATNWMGMPKEGVAKSGDFGGKPSFNNSKFSFDGTRKKFNVNVKYL
jgi:uncharacterized protein (DUF2141 family)